MKSGDKRKGRAAACIAEKGVTGRRKKRKEKKARVRDGIGEFFSTKH
ncbi:MAG: hypothetical protein IJ184_05345 [Alphaproteobacteria bacterium]|nr:hypothetical protein [Alphaproteobacteria bacterium]